jgi:hypothetical protein
MVWRVADTRSVDGMPGSVSVDSGRCALFKWESSLIGPHSHPPLAPRGLTVDPRGEDARRTSGGLAWGGCSFRRSRQGDVLERRLAGVKFSGDNQQALERISSI